MTYIKKREYWNEWPTFKKVMSKEFLINSDLNEIEENLIFSDTVSMT